MEFDDNDFGSQNVQLNNEEVSKSSSSPGLSTYSLAKYDFDDSLQGDIGFDSLVETETFLEIENQEDTSWIDDFSRGSRIEFSSQDAEPASISRRNNVWSEATSLESVEMLLKSVGQDDAIHGANEVQDFNAVQELGSTSKHLTSNEEDRDHLYAENVSSALALPIDECAEKVPDDSTVAPHPPEDVQYVSGKLFSPGSNMDSLLQDVDSETIQCPETEENQAMSADDNLLVDMKSEFNPIKAVTTIEELQEYVRTPAVQAESKVNCLLTDERIEVAENLRQGLNQGNATGSPSNQNLQLTGTRDLSEGPLNVSVEGVDDLVPEEEFKSEARSPGNTLDNVTSLEYMETVSGGELHAVGTGDNQLENPHVSSTQEHHDLNFADTCLGQNDTSVPAEGFKCEFDKHIDDIACDGSNVNSKSESAYVGSFAEATNQNSNASCVERMNSDALVAGSARVQNNELCASFEPNKNPEESANDDKIAVAGADIGDDEFDGGSKQVVNTVALKKPENSLTENDEVMGIPSSKMDSELSEDSSSPSKVCSSAALASVALATKDSVCTTPVEEDIGKVINIPASAVVEIDTMETAITADMIDRNDNCSETIIRLQSNSDASSMDGKKCTTGGSTVNDTRVASPIESVFHTQNEGAPYETPAIRAANEKGIEEPENSPLVVSCGSEIKVDTEIEKTVECQFDKRGSAFTDDGSVCQDPKPSDAFDNDKPFSFIITSSAEHSERETVNLWQPFTSQVPLSSQSLTDSQSTPKAEKNNAGNQVSHQNTDEQIGTGSISASVRKPRRASGKTTKESKSRQKSTTPSKLKESNIFPTVESCPPDSNIASSRPTVHRQHFTDLQQLQLRAQIFVYGSLIQGTTPDEACMVAAFGGPDGGRSIWENARQRCLARIHGQKLQDSNPETPVQQHSSATKANQKSKICKVRTKTNSVSRGKAEKSTPVHTTISHLTPPASPLWTLHTPDGLHFGGIPSKTSLEHNVHPKYYSQSSSSMTSTVIRTSTLSPHPTLVVSPQPDASKASSSLMMRTKMESVILTPVRESSVSEISVRPSNPGLIAHPFSHNSAIIKGPPLRTNDQALIMNSGQTLSDSRLGKRKKVVLGEASMITEPQLKFEATSAACVSSILSATVPTPNSEFKLPANASSPATVNDSSGDHTTKGITKTGDGIMSPEDICQKVDEAKLHAEDAAAYSSAAVDLSQKMWSQLAKQKDSGFAPDVEAEIASAALAIAAAVAVAKAAAAAAKVASDAAIQAKSMAEEAMFSSRISFLDSTAEISLRNLMSSSVNVTSSSIPNGENVENSEISRAAHENTESASTDLRRAENLKAIVKAAELAAEAVTRAGKVAVMGNPPPLSELANAGPEGCWKLTFGGGPLSSTAIDCHEIDAIRGASTSVHVRETVDVPKTTTDDCSFDNIPGDGCRVTSLDIGSNNGEPLSKEENSIKEGSSVEIYKEGDGVKGAWFSANVLELKNEEAYVCYTEKPPSESSGELKEWIKLQGNEAPKIRPAHPMTVMPTEGTRKRRREAMGKCFWSVGDRVDAWRQNCWWEGVITEKSSKDDTAFTVCFSAQGETSIIKACHLRPSLIWQDGKWVEWSSSISNDGDTRKEKRMKLCDSDPEVEVNENVSENVDPIDTKKKGDSRLLGLSDNEKTFNIGKSNKDVKKPVTHRTARTGLQNEGKTSFGVPKPGKKRKFMDVSEHYVSRDNKTNETNVSTRRAKMLIPKGSGLPGWKNSTRINLQEKKVPATQLKALNSKKPAAAHEKIVDKNSVSSTISRNDNASKSQGTSGFAAFSGIGKFRNSPFDFSSTSNEKSSKLLTSTSSKSELSNKTKFEPPSQKLGKIEENKVYNTTASTSNSEALEPRRSNRRIQPTSRLLEGLQTSLSIPKLPSVSHDKGLKSHNRNASSRSNH